jgi:SNF2 family DNA or RNA helicase
MAGEPGPFTELALEYEYETPRALPAFYVPVLSRAVRYDRTCGYFRASSLAIAAQGVARFVTNGGRMRLLCGVQLLEDEVPALQGDAPLPEAVEQRLKDALVTSSDIEHHRLGVLAWLVREGRLEVQLAIPKPGTGDGYFHEKQALFEDAHGNTICINGSNNESATGWHHNFESFWVHASWKTLPEEMQASIASVERRFDGDLGSFRRVPLSDAVVRDFVAFAPDDEPTRDAVEPEHRADRGTVARFLRVAPKLANGAATLAATSAVTPFPHQQRNVERLAGTYPRSWLLADEVGLGKTISAGLALRQLLLGGRLRRALVLAPANVCVQWQDELFEKFGLWVPRFAGQRLHGAHPDDVRPVAPGTNPYAEHDVLLVSSHLARLDAHREKLLAAPPYDLVVVDEAHHARRKGGDPQKREPSKLLRLLDGIRDAARTRALWLLTATPMQVDPIELYDLLVHVADDPEVVGTHYVQFERFYKQLNQPLRSTAWPFLANRVRAMPNQLDEGEEAQLARIEQRVGAYAAHQVATWAQSDDPHASAQGLPEEVQEELRAFIRQRGPIARYVLRHGRQTLRRYRDEGLLKEPIAERDVVVRTVNFSSTEMELYTELEDLLDRLNAAHGSTQAAGFILTTYRRRLTSSWAAIYATLRRRVEAEAAYAADAAGLDAAADDELADDALDEVSGQSANPQELMLAPSEIEEMRRFVERLAAMASDDAKLTALREDVDEARKTGRPIIVFTQYTDTLRHLRDALIGSYGPELAEYTGSGGRWFAKEEGAERVTKQELVEAVRTAKVTVLLCTDAASEGLNLQAASKLINYDLPWNPMRIEQRIGRIDRIGQSAPVVEIINYTIPGTVEENVYQALATRIDLFDGLVGELQPILGAVENSFKAIYRQPRSERGKIVREQLEELDARREQLKSGGVAYADDDLWPTLAVVEPAVDLAGLAYALVDDLQIDLDTLPHPTTSNPRLATRDQSGWRALATFGHPDIDGRINSLAEHASGSSALVIAEESGAAASVRADRSPPEPVGTLAAIAGLQDPVATGDADVLATQAVSDLLEAREAALDRWDAQRSHRERAALRSDLEGHLHRMLSLQALASGSLPVDQLWSDLISRPTPKVCRQLPTLIQHAGVGTREILSRYAPEQLEVGNADSLMREDAEALNAWWMRWERASEP